MQRSRVLFVLFAGAAAAVCAPPLAGCAASKPTTSEQRVMRVEQDIAFDELEIQHPNIREKANAAHAYAIFPRVAKGAFGVGGARGDGLVYEGSKQIGTAVLTQASIGAQIGGSTFRQLIIFEDERALRRFIGGRLEFSARAQATAGEGGGAGDISYEDGVAVYTVSAGGLMLDASIGGQDFEFFWHRDRSTIPAD